MKKATFPFFLHSSPASILSGTLDLSVRSRLKVPEEGPAGRAQATVLLSGCFESGERKALATLASVLGEYDPHHSEYLLLT